jgi:hypothetical protein
MISNMTIAAGPQELQSTQQASTVFFGPASVSQTSQTFKVTTAPFFLSAYALQNGDTITVQQVIGSGSGTETAAFAPVIGPVTLTPSVTCVRIDYPGRYQLVHSGPSALGTFTVVGAAQIMSSDSLAGLAQALASVVSNLGTTVTGTPPIVVTPSGLTYNVSLSDSGGLNTTYLGWTYHDLGTVVVSPLNINWTTSRAQKVISNVGGLLDVNIYSVLPNSPGFMWFMFTQGAGGDALQFTGAATPLVNAQGTIQPAQGVGDTTIYKLYFDGTNIWLDDFTSTETIGVGRFGGDSTDYIGGDNVTRTLFSGVDTNVGPVPRYVSAAGTDTYTCNPGPALTAYNSGQVLIAHFANANTGAATLNANALGAKAIQRRGVAVSAGQIPIGSTLQLVYDGTNFQIIGAA